MSKEIYGSLPILLWNPFKSKFYQMLFWSTKILIWEQIHIDNASAETWVATNHHYYVSAFASYILFYSIPTTIITNQSTNKNSGRIL